MSTGPDRSVLDRTGPEPSRIVPYGRGPHQVYEVHEPEGGPRAWVVLVHGGFWRAQWDRTHLRPLAGALTEQGYAVALVEYVRPGMPGGGWPATGEDVVAAVAAVLHDERDERDPGVVLVGHSAGGHLALWAMHRPELQGVRGAVSLAGCLDLHLVHDLDLNDGAAVNLMGSPPQDAPEDWAGADPARLGPAPYPVVVVHGADDDRVPLAVSRSWWQRAGTPDRDELRVLAGVGHFALIDPEAPAYRTLLDALEALLDLP